MADKTDQDARRILVELVPSQKKWVEKTMPYSSLVISIVAIVLSIWSAIETRHHNRLGATASVSFFLQSTYADKEVGIIIENAGSGAAKISEIKIYFDGRRINHWSDLESPTRHIFQTKLPVYKNYPVGLTLRPGDRNAL